MNDKVENQNVVKFVRMKNGDDLLTEAVEQKSFNAAIEEHYWTFMNPLKIVYMTNPSTGGFAVGLISWVSNVFAPEQTFNIGNEDILLMTNVTTDMANNYFNTLSEVKEAIETGGNVFEAIEEEDWEEPVDKKHYH